jgi:hypothetical protein
MSVGILGGVFYVLLVNLLSIPSAVNPPSSPREAAPPHQSLQALPEPPPPRTTVWVSTTALVTQSGVRASIVVTPVECHPAKQGLPLKAVKHTEGLQLRDLTMEENFCLEVSPGSKDAALSEIAGEWLTPSNQELPDFDQSTNQWSYLTPNGELRRVTVIAVAYCESEEGGCVGAGSIQNIGVHDAPVVTLPLPESGLSAVFLKSEP